MARIQAVAISIELLQEIMTQGWTVGDEYVLTCTKGLPAGAKFIGSHYAPDEAVAILEFEHESFPELALGEPASLIDVVFEFAKPVIIEPVAIGSGPCQLVA